MPLFSPKEPRFDPKPAQSPRCGLLLRFDLHFANVPQMFTGAVMIRSLTKGQPIIVHQGLLEGVELKFIDLQLGCAYMYVCSKRGRTLLGRSSMKKMEDMIHE